MPSIINFNPTPTVNFQFNPVLDGVTYVAICTWNAYGQRYYLSIYDNYGNLIMSRAMVGSPPEADINLLSGYFYTSTLVYRVKTSNFEITP